MTANKSDASRRPAPGLTVRAEAVEPPAESGFSRRAALQALSLSALAAAVAGCTRKPKRHVVSVPEMAEFQRPGVALWYASTWTDGDIPHGIMVKAVDGRPVKVEGLPGHPLTMGATSPWMQASLFSLYDPARLRTPERGGTPIGFEEADRQVVEALRGAGSALLVTRALLGPSERALVARFLAAVPAAKHLAWESIHDGERRAAWREVYGADGTLVPDFERASAILSIDSDFLGLDGDAVSATRQFAARRGVAGEGGAARLSRLWVAESAMTITGSNADHRIPLRPTAALDLVTALRAAVGGQGDSLATVAAKHHLDAPTLAALAEDLRERRGEALVLAGPHLPRAVHAAVALLNADLDAPGKALRWNSDPPTIPAASVGDLLAALEAAPDVVILLGVNPAHDAGDEVARALGKPRLVVAHGLTKNETLATAHLALPSAHNLESWTDARPLPGVDALGQPLIAPLFDGRQEMESLLLWAKAAAPEDPALAAATDWHDWIRDRWIREVLAGSADPAVAWEAALSRGFVGEPRLAAPPRADAAKARALIEGGPAPSGAGLDLVLVPHPAALDGRHAGNAWLLETPDPVSRLVWDNAAQVGPATAERLGVRERDWISISVGDRTVEAPVLLQPGTAPDTVVLPLGMGRRAGAGAGDGVGVSGAPLLGRGVTPWFAAGVGARPADRPSHPLVRVQLSFSQEGRPLVVEGTRAEYEADPDFVRGRFHLPPRVQLDDEWDYSKGHKWGIAIDLSLCTGCNACVVACQSENNIPVVGKDDCAKNRDMAWLRIDRYEEGDPENPWVGQQPMLCQHCDNAPCETVCPVNATSHSPEGLNEQTYNRCVGTRYCSNNCPYKVRKFNFFNYTKREAVDPVKELLANPSVTVRSRGVMEKCTFCIQRINAAKFRASNEARPLADGEIRTACQQACPAGAIVFGDANDPESELRRRRSSPLAYQVLEELNARPNVTYLARVRNPHPRLAAAPTAGGHR